MVTVIDSPASASPQTLFFCPCCKTMWLPKMFGSFTSARLQLAPHNTNTSVAKQIIRCMEVIPFVVGENCDRN